MGGSSKVTVGYKYFMGLHFALSHGPVDALKKILCGDRVAWCGNQEDSGEIEIAADDLFGGEDREGGVAGRAQVLMGEGGQTADSYLTAQLGSNVPAYRGVFSVLFKGPSDSGEKSGYIAANNPYIKPWAFQVQRITSGWACGEAWYAEKAAMAVAKSSCSSSVAAWIALDYSSSMDQSVGGGLTRLDSLKAAMTGVFDSLVEFVDAGANLDIAVVIWSHNQVVQTRFSADAEDLNELDIFVNQTDSSDIATDFTQAVTGMGDFFNASGAQNRIFIFLTDGEPYLDGSTPAENANDARDILQTVPNVAAYAFNIDLSSTAYTSYLDNTPKDGVPVLDGSDSDEIAGAIEAVLQPIDLDAMNPAHIVYQCVTDPNWGMGYPASSIDEDNFTAVADQLYDEEFGLCLQWTQQESIESFIGQIMDHIGGVFYADATTGKFKITLIRDDYDAGDLDELDESSIMSLDSFQRVGYGETVNEINVVFREVSTNTDSTVTAQDLANIQAQGGIVSQTRQYPGIPNAELAQRVAERDLISTSTPLAKLTVTATRGAGLRVPGDVIKVSWPKLGLSGLVCRVLDVDYGSLSDGRIRLQLAEDVFGLPDSAYAAQQPKGWVEPDTDAAPVTLQAAYEIPYYQVATTLPGADVEKIESDAGYVGTVAARDAQTWLGYKVFTRIDDAAFETFNQTHAFSPTLLIDEDIDQQATTVAFTGGVDLSQVPDGGLAMLGDGSPAELVNVTDIDIDAGEITIARGMLDTTPADHESGTRLWFLDFAGFDPTERSAAEEIDIRLPTVASGGELDVSSATTMQLTMDQRFFRPYPPGNVQVNGEAWPSDIEELISVSWSHRDRLQQTAGLIEQDEASIGPEDGTTYNIYLYNDDTDALMLSESNIVGTSWEPTELAVGGNVRLELAAERDGVESWQRQVRRFTTSYALSGARLLEDGSVRLLEDGAIRLLEEEVDPEVVDELQIPIDRSLILSGKIYGILAEAVGSGGIGPTPVKSIRSFDAGTYVYESGVALGTDSYTVTAFLQIGGVMYASTIGGGFTNQGVQRITETNVANNEPGSILRYYSGLGDAQGLANVGGDLWASNYYAKEIVKLNVDTLAVEYQFSVSFLAAGGPSGLSSDGSHIYAVMRGPTSKLVKFTTAGLVVWQVNIQSYATDCLYQDGKIWVLGTTELAVYDETDGSELDSFSVGGADGVYTPSNVPTDAIRFDGTDIIVAARSGGVLGFRRYDPSTLAVTGGTYIGRYWAGESGSDMLLTDRPTGGDAPTTIVYGSPSS